MCRVFILAVMLLAGCVSNKSANYSKAILNSPPAGYKEHIVGNAKTYFLDPYSIKSASISQPTVQTIWRGIFGGAVDGWLVCVEYNIKGNRGGYLGLSRDGYFYRDDGKLDILPNLRECHQPQLAFSPFPELESIK